MQSKPAGKMPLSHIIDPVLLTARHDLARGDLPSALHAYNHLIQHSRSLKDVLPELAQLVKNIRASHRLGRLWEMHLLKQAIWIMRLNRIRKPES